MSFNKLRDELERDPWSTYPIDKKLLIALLDELDRQAKDVEFLSCLRAAGVDNWSGYDYAWELFRESSFES